MNAEQVAAEIRSQLNGLSRLQYSVLTILLEQHDGSITFTAGELMNTVARPPVRSEISVVGSLVTIALNRQHLN